MTGKLSGELFTILNRDDSNAYAYILHLGFTAWKKLSRTSMARLLQITHKVSQRAIAKFYLVQLGNGGERCPLELDMIEQGKPLWFFYL